MNLNCGNNSGCRSWMANTCFVWQRLLCMAGCVFLETNAMAAPATLIAANVGDRVQGAVKFVYAQGSDPDTQDKVENCRQNAAKVDQADDKVASLSAKHSVIRLR